MKRLISYSGIIGAFCLLASSCATDDVGPSYNDANLWKGEIADAPYAKDAICMEFENNAQIDNKLVKSIELSASGLYYVSYSAEQVDYNPAKLRKSKQLRTRDWMPYNSVKTGNFTPMGSGKYQLDDFGIITITDGKKVNIELENGESYIWPFTELKKIESSALNNRLCRTWNLVDGRVDFLDKDLKVIYSLPISKQIMEYEYIYAITFCNSERVYRQDEPGDNWYGGNWWWSNESMQLVGVTSDDEEDGEGIFQVIFDGNEMQIMNPSEFEYGEDAMYEFDYLPGSEEIPSSTRYAREYINLKAMN